MSDSIPKRRKMRPLNAIAIERANKVKLNDKRTNPSSPILDDNTNEWAQNNKTVKRDHTPQKSDDNLEKQGESMDIATEKDATKKKKQESATEASDIMEIDTPVTQASDNVSNESVKQKAKAKKVRNADKEQNHTVRDKMDEAPNKKTEAKDDTKQDEKKKRKEEKRAVKHAEKEQKKMTEKTDSSTSKEEQKAKKRKEKHERKGKKKQQKMSMDGKQDSTTHQKSSNKTADKASTDITAETTQHKNGTTSSQQYQSASDSDDSDNEKSTTPTAPTKKKAPTFLQGLSDSDSDDTDNEKTKKPTKPTKKAPAYLQGLSDSDSDDTDNEKTRKPTKKKNVAPTHQQTHDSSNEKSAKSTKEKRMDLTRKDDMPEIKSSTHIHDSDDEDDKNRTKMSDLSRLDSANYRTNFDALDNNRILSRYRKKFDENDSVETKLNRRFNADIVPTVENDFFISDSDSATESDDSYSHPSPHAWHNETGYYGKHGVQFPKGRKFGFTDRIKLEKRIKKIWRRQGRSFDDFKEFTQGDLQKNKSDWRMIAKVFPDRTLRQIAMYCQEAYSPHKEFGAVTKTDIQEFKKLVELNGENRKFLASTLGITVGRVRYLLDIVRGRTLISEKSLGDNDETTKKKTRWTDEEVALLLQKAEQNRRANGTIDYDRVALAFDGKFTALQVRAKYRNVEGLKIKKDGKLQKKRNISPVTVLEYYKCLLQQAQKLNLQDESQLEFRRGIDNPLAGYQGSSTYLKARLNIKGVEKMKVKEILTKLVERQERSVTIQREEGLLE